MDQLWVGASLSTKQTMTMIIFTMRTDKPEAEIGLYEDSKQLVYQTWTAHRELAETLHGKVKDMLVLQHKDWSDIQGIVVFKGPGSFTGLRIGLSVGNALAQANNMPIVSESGERWINEGIERLLKGENQKIVIPEYGGEVFTTQQKK